VQAANQAAAGELLLQALENGDFRLAVDYRASVAESDNIGPTQDRCRIATFCRCASVGPGSALAPLMAAE